MTTAFRLAPISPRMPAPAGRGRVAWKLLLLAAAVAPGLHSTPASAQAAVQASAARHVFDLPSQPLSSALLAYTRVTGVQIALSADIARNKTAPVLHGAYSDDEALTRLLAGSGLRYRHSGQTIIVSENPDASAAPAEASTLPTIEVVGSSDAGYVSTQAAAATKTDASLIETPQSVSVVTRDQMDDQEVQSVRQALRYTPGLTSEYRGAGGTRYDTIIYRGMGGGVNYDYSYLDGMRLLGGNYLIPQIDTYMLDRIEVLRGPSSVLYGQGTPGGLVNLVSKKPTDEPLHEIELQAGNHGFGQLGFDFSGPLDKDGKVLYRLTGVGHTDDTQIAYQKDQRVAIAPSVTIRPDADTSLTLQAQYLHDPYGGYYGFLPAVGTVLSLPNGSRIDRNFYDGSPNFDEFNRTQKSLGYELEHRFNDTWSMKSSLRYMSADLIYKSVYTTGISLLDPSNPMLTRGAIYNVSHMDTLVADNHAQAKFSTGALKHTALVGIDYQRMSLRQDQGTGAAPSLSIDNPNYSAAVATPALTSQTTQVQDQLGLYAQDQARWGKWTVLGGIRQDWADNDQLDRLTGISTNQADQAFTWRLGSVYEFDNGLAPYVSYSRSFQPVIGADAGGNLFKPMQGEQYEAGVKYAPPGYNAFITAAVYQLTQKNALTTDPNNVNYSIQTGETRSRGLELEGKMELTRNLDLTASYTFMDSRNTQSTTAQGKRPTYVPQHMANAWLNYAFHKGSLDGLSLGAGVRYVGPSYVDAANTIKVSPFTLVDAAIRYDLGQAYPALKGATVALNVTNLFDKPYVSACATATKCFWGAGRTIIGTLAYRW